ncbi:MAG TPA: epoxide hydrolase [Candidatus Tectomicrobia bacterium]
MTEPIQLFEINVAQHALDDLRERLLRTRWPDAELVGDWSQGVPLLKIRALCDYWAEGYDWRRCEQVLNGFGQYRTTIDGLGIHFLHIRSPEPRALPVIMTHGWPGSVLEFAKLVGPLTDPARHGGNPEDAFDLVLPSLPGYGFSDKPPQLGWDAQRTAAAWGTLMQRLGYERWVAQGGDWGSVVTRTLGASRTEGCLGIHLNLVFIPPAPEDMATLTPAEQAMLRKAQLYQDEGSGYAKQQSTRPQTLGYGLNDSPAGLAAWIYEKLQEWTANDGAVEDVLTVDEILDNITLYWLTGTATSSARFYWENRAVAPTAFNVDLPTGITQFPGDIFNASRRWVERAFSSIIHWSEASKGGHFAAWEQPDIFVDELRNCFRKLR